MNDIHLDRKETLRYLGYRGHAPDGNVAKLIDKCASEVENLSTIRYIYRIFDDLHVKRCNDCGTADEVRGGTAAEPRSMPEASSTGAGESFCQEAAEPDSGARTSSPGIAVSFGGVTFESRDLARHLEGCEATAVLCATLGTEADRIRLRYETMDMTMAVVTDAAQSAYIEQVCDEACGKLLEEYARNSCAGRERGEACEKTLEVVSENMCGGLFSLTDRFSPGYGDLSLDYQEALLRLADARRRIGLTRSDSNMLAPQKSVTAIVGLRRVGTVREGSKGEAFTIVSDAEKSAEERIDQSAAYRGCGKSCDTCPARAGCIYRKSHT